MRAISKVKLYPRTPQAGILKSQYINKSPLKSVCRNLITGKPVYRADIEGRPVYRADSEGRLVYRADSEGRDFEVMINRVTFDTAS